jgi:hypothetical protein
MDNRLLHSDMNRPSTAYAQPRGNSGPPVHPSAQANESREWTANELEAGAAVRFRWIPRLLAFLVLLCLALAVWVWFEILHT